MTSRYRHAGMAMMALAGALLILAWATPQAMGVTGGEPASDSRLSAHELRALQEARAGLKRPSGEQVPANPRLDRDSEGNPYFAGELVVTYREAAPPVARQAIGEESGARVREKLSEIDAAVFSFPEVKVMPKGKARAKALERKKRELEADPAVETAEYNYALEKLGTVNDPLFGKQWGLQRIKAPRAWDTTRGRGAIIAIIDGGAQSTHPDLNGAFVDEWDYYNGDATANDEDGHGTHVAGIAAAYTNNATGVAGTAPDAPLFNYDVCGLTTCRDSAIASAIVDAADMGADVINMSLGGGGNSTNMQNAVNYAWNKGVVVVAAAGNSATSTPTYPAAYSNVIAVSGTDYYNGDSDFSNYGDWVDVAAPGGDGGATYGQRVLSSVPTYVHYSGYDSWNGTSMASPFVAGVAALLGSQGLKASQIRQRIQSTATDLGPSGRDRLFGHGLVNAQAAVEALTDSARPEGTVLINGGRVSTASRTVTLSFRASDPAPGTGVASMRLRNAGGSWSRWQPYATSASWRLGTGAGTKTVYAQYRDRAGNVSASASDSIRYRP